MFALGICYFWPTMLGVTSERLPKTGAVGLALMGGAGMLSAAFIQPVIGRVFDDSTARALPAGASLVALKAAAPGTPEAALLAQAQMEGGVMPLRLVALLPLVLVLVFGLLYLGDRARGGYRPEALARQAGGGA